MRKVLEIYDTQVTLLEIADFFHSVVDKTEDVKPGTDVKGLAKSLGIAIPDALQDGTISVVESGAEESRGRSILVLYGERIPSREPGEIARKKCFTICKDVGPAKFCITVCAECSVRNLSCEISINTTITVGL